jgi:hypothetical protein
MLMISSAFCLLLWVSLPSFEAFIYGILCVNFVLWHLQYVFQVEMIR